MMTLKNKLLATSLFAGLVTLTSTSALAAQEIQGEFFKVSSDSFGGYCSTPEDSAKFKAEIINQIKNAGINVCAGRDFSFDKISFSTSQKHFVLHPCDIDFRMSGTTTVFCKN